MTQHNTECVKLKMILVLFKVVLLFLAAFNACSYCLLLVASVLQTVLYFSINTDTEALPICILR